ncbi:patatin-like phospholipase family protein [Psychrobacter sp. 1176_08]|uniref:patatin-like phospholipase family protein n=1 Tax=Psychrobacter sp. 1176_08 TaxID=2604452 RepID=UPI004064AC43
MKTTHPYERVQLFSGGGSRFGYYLGSYAALVEHDLKPGLIIGTCGGSLSALLVQLAPDPVVLKQLIESHALYKVIGNITHVAPDEVSMRHKWRYASQAFNRWRTSHLSMRQSANMHADLLDELQHLAMFRITNDDQWLDELIHLANTNKQTVIDPMTPDIAIIASRLYQGQAAQTARGQPQLQEVLFAPLPLAHRYRTQLIPNSTTEPTACTTFDKLISPVNTLARTRIHQNVAVLQEWEIATAVRASMSDMYYLPPIHIRELGWCLGGVINLTPIELAAATGHTVFAETKAGYDRWLAAPAIRHVFGFDPNVRLAQVHQYQHRDGASGFTSQIHWLPFSDNAAQLVGQQVRKRLNMKTAMIELVHSSHDTFVRQMQAQWDYGYKRTVSYIQQHL